MKEELVGFKNVQDVVVKCNDCGKPLINIVLTCENSELAKRGLKTYKIKYKVTDCCFCRGESFFTHVFEGSTIIGTVSDNISFEIEDTEIIDDIIHCIITTKRLR